MRLRILSVLAALILPLVGVAAVASPAHAAHTDCPVASICGWDSEQWGNPPVYHWTITALGGGCINIGAPWNEQFDSLKNNMSGSGYIVAYKGAGCGGGTITTLQSLNTFPRLGNCFGFYNSWANSCGSDGNSDRMSSIWYYRY